MSVKVINTPKLRFKGFSDEWEQCKLGDISNKVTEKNKNNEFNETFTNSAEYGIINQRDFFDKDISNKEKLNGYYIVREDDFVYNPRISNFAPVGPINRNKTGRIGVMSPLYYIFRTNNINELYLEYYFDTTYWHKFMKLNGDTGVRSDRLSIKDSVFKLMPIPLPDLKEQQKIGTFFNSLDHLITLHQHKLENLEQTKKGLLQNMFPKNNEVRPYIRFNNFIDEWEQCKLGEVARLSSSKRIHLSDYVESGIPFYRGSEISTGGITGKEELYISEEKYNEITNKYEIPVKGDLLITAVGTLGNVWKVDNRRFYYKDGNLIRISDMNFNSDYFVSYLSGGIGKKRLIDSAAGSNQKALTMVKMKKILIPLPSKDEQTKIGNLFSSLDHLIALHQSKLEKLEKTKQSLLQQMFV